MFHLSLPSTFGVHFWSLLYIIPFLPQKITLKQFKKTVLKFYEVFYAFYCGRDCWLMAMMTVYMTMVKEKTDLFGLLAWSPVTCDHTPDTLPPCTYKKNAWMQVRSPGNKVAVEKSKANTCRFVESKNGLSLSQIVTLFLSVFVGCQWIRKRLSPHFWAMPPVAKTPWKASIMLHILLSQVEELRNLSIK